MDKLAPIPKGDHQRLKTLMVDNPDPHGIINETTHVSSDQDLFLLANRFFTSEEPQETIKKYFRARIGVLTSSPDEMRENLKKGAGMTIDFPDTNLFPIRARETLIFGDKEQLEKYAGKEMADSLIARQIAEIQEQLGHASAHKSKFIRDLTTIAQARIGGAEADDIITPKYMRMSLATEVVIRELCATITKTRESVRDVVCKLMDKSSNGVDAVSLTESMQSMHKLCLLLIEKLEELQTLSSFVIAKPKGADEPNDNEKINKFVERAKEIFQPFIHGNHLVTMEQLGRMEDFLNKTGGYYRDVAEIIECGINSIDNVKEAGDWKTARDIRECLNFHEIMSVFRTVTNLLNQDLSHRAIIYACVGAQNRVFLDSVPPPMLERAKRESGIDGSEYMERALTDTDYGVNDFLVGGTHGLIEP